MSLVSADVPPAILPRRRQSLFGAAFAAAGASMVVLTLFSLYAQSRAASQGTWLQSNQIPLTQPNMQMISLAMSIVTMQWAVWAIARDERGQAMWASGITLLLGAAYINQTWFLWSNSGISLDIAEGKWFYAVTGAHVAMAAFGLAYLFLMTFRVIGGSFGSRYPDGLAAPALFWHVTALLYLPIWVGVYVAK